MTSFSNNMDAPVIFYRPAPKTISDLLTLNDDGTMANAAQAALYVQRYTAWSQSATGQPIIFYPGLTLNVSQEDIAIVENDESYQRLAQLGKVNIIRTNREAETRVTYGVNVLKDDETVPVWQYKDSKGESTVDKAELQRTSKTKKPN
jgi:hypothetical protein